MPRFFEVLDFEAQFCGFLQHCGLRLLVPIVDGLWFTDVIVVHGFSVALQLKQVLHAALECYTDVCGVGFQRFWTRFAVFGIFCCGYAVFATPQ